MQVSELSPRASTRSREPLPPIVTVEASDGYPLAVRVHEPNGHARGTLLIHSATATPQTYYGRFGAWAARRGFRTVTYDYRGIGSSLVGSIRNVDATMTDWAVLDAAAVLHFARTFGDGLVSIGHSFGGQAMGLSRELHDVDGAIFVGAQLGYFRHWPLAAQARYATLWYALIPLTAQLVGYIPKELGMGEDLPGGVALEWAKWCRSPHYYIDARPEALDLLRAFARPALAYSFSDDAYAPPGAVDAFIGAFAPAHVHHRRLTPAAVGVDEMGHFGFFREARGGKLWDEALAFADDVLGGRPPRVAKLATREPLGIRLDEIMHDLTFGRED